jgi:hypothetical protein
MALCLSSVLTHVLALQGFIDDYVALLLAPWLADCEMGQTSSKSWKD